MEPPVKAYPHPQGYAPAGAYMAPQPAYGQPSYAPPQGVQQQHVYPLQQQQQYHQGPPASNSGGAHTGVSVVVAEGPDSAKEDSSSYSAAFMDKRVRHGFIRKVYAILSLQLIVTFGIMFLFVFENSVKQYVQTHPAMLYSALGLNFAFIIVLSCCPTTTKVVPYNYWLLFAFTLTESYLVGVISSFYDTNAVLIAFGITIGIVFALTVFAFQTKYDFTTMGGILVSLLFSLILLGFLMIWFKSQALYTFYAALGAFIFSAFIVVDTQRIIGGNHAMQFTPDEYISAALNLYIDIVQLFLMLLRLLGRK